MRKLVAVPEDLPKSQTVNPYWDIVRLIPGNEFDMKYGHYWSPDWTMALDTRRIDRQSLCGEYTWAIPDPASLQFVAEHLAPRAIEIGAGTGYWAWQLSQLSVDMLCYDLHPPQHTGKNIYHSPRTEQKNKLAGHTREVFYDVHAGNHLMAARHADRTLFLCWPPYDEEMAKECLQAYTGQKLVYIGEGEGGCNATDAFFEMVAKGWNKIASHNIVQWWGLHDWITVYERIEQ